MAPPSSSSHLSTLPEYDAVPYVGSCYRITHPDHLHAVARLHGLPARKRLSEFLVPGYESKLVDLLVTFSHRTRPARGKQVGPGDCI